MKVTKKRLVLAVVMTICILVGTFSGVKKHSNVNADEPLYLLVIETPEYYGSFGVDFSRSSQVTLKWGYYPKGKDYDIDWSDYINVLDANEREDMVVEGYVLKGFGTNQTDLRWRVNESIKVKKSDFTEKDEEGNYIYHVYGVFDWHDEWVDGKWFSSDGSQTYSGRGDWKGTGTEFWYETDGGWYPSSCWQKIEHDWYYFKDNGYCACDGWLDINGSWYYFDKNGWFEYDGWIDGYWINEDGTQTYPSKGSWQSDSKGWYFMDESGWYPTKQFMWVDGECYYFKKDGYMACNEKLTIEEEYNGEKCKYKYTFDSNGLTTDVEIVD